MKQIIDSVQSIKTSYTRLLDSAQDKDKQQQTLTMAYMGALSVIAVLTIISHFLTAYITNSQKENAEITFAMTNMRSQADIIVSQASTFKMSSNSFDDDLLGKSIDKLKQESDDIEAGRSGDTIHDIFHADPYLLNDKIGTFITAAGEFARFQRTGQRTEAEAAFNVFRDRIAKLLSVNLDLALEEYHTGVLEQVKRSFRLQNASVMVILAVLLLEATFIFRPLVLRLAEYHKDLIRLALTDVLTGLNNRRAFMQLASAGLDHFHRHKKPFALVIMDLDKFKNVNDTYGHKVGDLVLQHYSGVLLKFLRKHDILGRIGGEEFAIFLPQTSAQEAQQIMERLRKTVMETPCPYMDKDDKNQLLSYTSSFGIVAVTSGTWTLDNLLIKADENLYKAKEQGRNCVILREL
jgi:diguanylate cyclase (GGDEF)-like protein